MAHRPDDLLQSQRAFVAHASHQLRTPLTALRLRLENLQDGLGEQPSAEIEAAIDEATRLATLVTDLLQLARADARPLVGVADLVRLTADRVDTWSAVAEPDGIMLHPEASGRPMFVRAVPGAIEQILDNLLDNAVTASPPGSAVVVAVTTAPGSHRLTISDAGPGLTDEQKANATQRFWRGDTTTPGTGLGVAIVDALVSASDGTLELADAPGGDLSCRSPCKLQPTLTRVRRPIRTVEHTSSTDLRASQDLPPLALGWDDDYRAGAVGHQLVRHRSEQQAFEAAEASRAEHEQVGIGGGGQQRSRREVVDGALCD